MPSLTQEQIDAFRANPMTIIGTWWLHYRMHIGAQWTGPVVVQHVQDNRAFVSICSEDTLFWVDLNAMLLLDHSAFEYLGTRSEMGWVHLNAWVRLSGRRFQVDREPPDSERILRICQIHRPFVWLQTSGPDPEYREVLWQYMFVDYEHVGVLDPRSREIVFEDPAPDPRTTRGFAYGGVSFSPYLEDVLGQEDEDDEPENEPVLLPQPPPSVLGPSIWEAMNEDVLDEEESV